MAGIAYKRVDRIPSSLETHNREESAAYRRLANLVLLHAKTSAALTDDEIIVLSVLASQAAIWRHIDPDNVEADDLMTELLAILDDYQVNLSMQSKMEAMLDGERPKPRPDAPRPEDMPELIVKWRRELEEAEDAPGLEDLP